MSTIPKNESMIVEFKNDLRCLSDRELIEAVVCMANAQGGDIYLGVEDSGRPTGLHPNHQHIESMAALISNRTQPSVQVNVTSLIIDNVMVAKISVPASPHPIATNDGTLKRRRLQTNGSPECVPYLPHEFSTRQAHFGLLDIRK